MLLDKLEQMDLTTLTEFSAWLEAEDLQAIATRVSHWQRMPDHHRGRHGQGPNSCRPPEQPQPNKSWTKGAF